jgi:methionyl-tRNA formyltransferase
MQTTSATETNSQSCVLVSDRPWNSRMAARLESRTGRRFILLTRPEELGIESLEKMHPQFVFFPHWSHRIPESLFNQFACVIFHMTDLPFGRGGSPLQNLIARGIYETKITALRCVEEMDAGPIYLKKPFGLHGSAEEIFMRASGVMEDMIVEMLEKLPEPIPQEGTPTVFKRRRPEEGNLAGAQSLEQVFDLIRMLDAEGYPNAFLNVGPFKLEFTRASMKSDQVAADVRISLVDNAKERDKQ